ncbi:PAS domain S-box protein [Geotalea uraniireducens]|uniref:histidine kinase n=1 Tax=Geotalea uraniireducens (strain Rf4) TaxID=351605 RepID=A5GAB8_GEOUR|nr:PAS domain S-box protein [Geotalea uraniireducens]ABQ25487.1 multi-sensor signal transduction histidine kinase [Geotalea uraniireducens Rf4]
MRMRNMSLKTRMALAVSSLFVVFTTTLVCFAVSYYEREYKKTISRQQYALVSSLANSVDDKLEILLNALEAGSPKISLDDITNADSAQRFLDNRFTLTSLFDNGLFIISRDGRLIAESPYLPNRRGKDISFRDFYKKTVAAGRPQISEPYLSTHNPDQPAIMLTVPIFDRQGKMLAILGGSINLMGKNILQGLTPFNIGATGYIYLCDSNRNLIVHPDKSRIMKPGTPPGVNMMFDRAIAGFEGSGETVNSSGVTVLASFKHLRTTDWILAANYPVAEAYAPLHKAVYYFVSAITVGVLAVLLLAWLLMKRLTEPLLAFTRHVESLPEKAGAQKQIAVDSSDEIGTLAKAFNAMLCELERRQEALRESEERYKAVFQNSHTVMMLLDPETAEIVDVNTAACRFYGHAKDELTRMRVTEINTLPPSEVFAEMNLARREERNCFSFRHRLADGSIRDVEVHGGPVRVKGKLLLFSVIHDITARKEAEDAFNASHTLLEKTLASLNEAVFIVETKTREIQDCNITALKMFGYERDQLIGARTSCLHVTEENSEWFGSEMLKSYERKGYFEVLFQMKRADGTVFPSEHFVTPIYDSDGNITSNVCVVRDITERKRAEDESRRLNELLEQRVGERTAELEASNKELEAFCYSVSHDLRTPLRGIDGFCSIVRQDYADKLDKPGREYLERIGSAAVRMGQLIDDLLNLSMVTRSQLTYDMVDLSHLARDIAQEFLLLEPDRRVEFEIADGVMAKADRRLIRSALENMLHNAWKFSSREQCTRIEFGVDTSEGDHIYYVRDNGVGFDMIYAHKLFRPFQRLHGMTEFVGTGVGLASVQRIVARHGGRVWVEAEPGKGATFFFTLAN